MGARTEGIGARENLLLEKDLAEGAKLSGWVIRVFSSLFDQKVSYRIFQPGLKRSTAPGMAVETSQVAPNPLRSWAGG